MKHTAIQIDSASDIIAKFTALEKRIDTADAESIRAQAESIRARWEFGQLMLHRRNGGKRLPNGLLVQLTILTGKGRSELQYRAQFAERYPTEDELSTALDNYDSWTQVKLSLPDRDDDDATGDADADAQDDAQGLADVIELRQGDDGEESTPAKRHGNSRQQATAAKNSVLDLSGITGALERVFGGKFDKACTFEKTYTKAQSAKDAAALKGYAARLNLLGDKLGSHGGKAKTRRRKRSTGGDTPKGSVAELRRLRLEIDQMSTAIKDYNISDYDLADDAYLDLAVDIFGDLLGLGEWVDGAVSATQAHLSEVKVLAKIGKLRDTTGRTAAEAETARKLADKLEAKLTKRLP